MTTRENKPDPESLEALQRRYWQWHLDRVAEDRGELQLCPAEFDRLNIRRS
jgi:hypothetical protein